MVEEGVVCYLQWTTESEGGLIGSYPGATDNVGLQFSQHSIMPCLNRPQVDHITPPTEGFTVSQLVELEAAP